MILSHVMGKQLSQVHYTALVTHELKLIHRLHVIAGLTHTFVAKHHQMTVAWVLSMDGDLLRLCLEEWSEQTQTMLARARHACTTGHEILFSNIKHMFVSASWGEGLIREVLQIRLEASALNHEDDLRLSSTWIPALEFSCILL